MKRVLQVLDPHDLEMHVKKVSLNPVYYGGVVSKKLLLYNNSPISSDFTIIMDKEMSECVNMNKSLALTFTKHELKRTNEEEAPCLDVLFEVSPNKVSCVKNKWYTVWFLWAWLTCVGLFCQ